MALHIHCCPLKPNLNSYVLSRGKRGRAPLNPSRTSVQIVRGQRRPVLVKHRDTPTLVQFAGLQVGLFATHGAATPPPPITHMAEPCPWSVPRLPFSRTARPNLDITTTNPLYHSGPSASSIGFRPSATPCSGLCGCLGRHIQGRSFGRVQIRTAEPNAGGKGGSRRVLFRPAMPQAETGS